jgi:hypothetical protein
LIYRQRDCPARVSEFPDGTLIRISKGETRTPYSIGPAVGGGLSHWQAGQAINLWQRLDESGRTLDALVTRRAIPACTVPRLCIASSKRAATDLFAAMNATKILGGQVLLVGTVVLAFIWTATEWTAWKLGFQLLLGQPWFELIGWRVYQPPAFFRWFAYDAYARPSFIEGAYIAASGGIAAIVVADAMSVWGAREVRKVTTYGSAGGPETREVRRADLLHADSVLLGCWRGGYLRFAPTGSGKGVGLVVRTLPTCPGSTIVDDVKGENWTLSAGWRCRAQFHQEEQVATATWRVL